MLDATAHGGPHVTPTTPLSFGFTTANSLNNPLQKDVVLKGAFSGTVNSPMPGGDFVTASGGTVMQPIIASVTTGACGPSGTSLTAQVNDL